MATRKAQKKQKNLSQKNQEDLSQTLEYPHGVWEHQSRTLEFPLCSSGMGFAQMISPLTVRWDSGWTVTILNLMALVMPIEDDYVGPR